jgi:outer membrane protein TolC
MKAIRTSIVWAVSFCAGVTAVSSGCSMAPTYERAAVPEPQAFKESPTLTPEEVGTWKQAEPSESYSCGEWWRVFDDLQLDDYEMQALAANQDLKAAAARVLEARAVASSPLKSVAIQIPPGLPASLLERRPDITAAERAMAAENARIGIARAAYFPSLQLTAAGGFELSTLSNLLNWSNRTFLLGPFFGTALNIPVFDGGRRRDNLDNARARYDEAVARYRQQVLTAFREVEDNLANLRILKDQLRVQDAAVQASTRASDLSGWRMGSRKAGGRPHAPPAKYPKA